MQEEADPVRGICGAHGGHETEEMLGVQSTNGGRGLRGGAGKRWMRYLPDLRAVGINADKWMTAVQDEGKWRKTADQGVGRFMAKLIAAEKGRARLRHAVVYKTLRK